MIPVRPKMFLYDILGLTRRETGLLGRDDLLACRSCWCREDLVREGSDDSPDLAFGDGTSVSEFLVVVEHH